MANAKREIDCARLAHEESSATHGDFLDADSQRNEESRRATRKRRRSKVEEMGEDAPKRKAPRHREPSPGPWNLPEGCHCTEHITEDFCEGNLRSPSGSMKGFSGEWDEAHRPKLDELVLNEQEPSKRLSGADLALLWSYPDAEPGNSRHFPAWAKTDEVTIHLQRQLKRSRPGGRTLGELFVDDMDDIESSSMPGVDSAVANDHRPSKRAKLSSKLDDVDESRTWRMPSVGSNAFTQNQIPDFPAEQSEIFETANDSGSPPMATVNAFVIAEDQPPELPTKQGSETDATNSIDVLPPYRDLTYNQPLELLEKQDNSSKATRGSGPPRMSENHSNIAAHRQPSELPVEHDTKSDAMYGIESRPMSGIDGGAVLNHQPPKLPPRKGSKRKPGVKGANKKGGGKLQPNVVAGTPSVKKAKAKKAKDATPAWLLSVLEKPRQTRSQSSKILCELDAQSRVVLMDSRSQRNGRLR
ncbi:MAG: hypothetical protein Q9216_005553 [Gyalolechia sp. 2 TL-2023]